MPDQNLHGACLKKLLILDHTRVIQGSLQTGTQAHLSLIQLYIYMCEGTVSHVEVQIIVYAHGHRQS